MPTRPAPENPGVPLRDPRDRSTLGPLSMDPAPHRGKFRLRSRPSPSQGRARSSDKSTTSFRTSLSNHDELDFKPSQGGSHD